MTMLMGVSGTRGGGPLVLACLVAALSCGTGDSHEPAPPGSAADAGPQPDPVADPQRPDAAATEGLVVSFLLDPRITTSVYTGERWVTPETFTLVHEGDVVPVHARAHLADSSGTTDVSATWTPADGDMLSVSLADAHQVELTVRRAGQTALTVTHGESSRILTVFASRDAGGAWRVDILQ
jgi:hypothetical protein